LTEILNAGILALVQGLTEFLPVSSSGHLVIASSLLGLDNEDILLEIFLHFGTFLSVLVIFRQDILDILSAFFRHIFRFRAWGRAFSEDGNFRLSIYLIVAILPAGIAGLLFKDFFESLFNSLAATGTALIVTGLLLLGTYWAPKSKHEITLGRGLLIGLAQAFAIIPGISRSGSTISTALYLGIAKEKAARFSFIMALPLVFGATLLEGLTAEWGTVDILPILLGTALAFVSGYAAIKWLLALLVRGKFHHFAWYCLLLGTVTLGYTLL